LSGTSRRCRLELAYDGTGYAGWQVQPGQKTIQGVLEHVLTRLDGGEPVRVRGAGRTDAGTHARGQVVDFLLRSELEMEELAYALRRMLPDEIRPARVEVVERSFNARHDALRKCYRYRLDRSSIGDPFLARYALHYRQEIDRDAVGDALLRLPGRKEWTGFASSKCRVENRVREMLEARYDEEDEGEGWFTFTAEGFLTHMVRNIVGTLLEISEARYGPSRIDEILASRDRGLAGPTAPARGLYLWRVDYGEPLAERSG
jgi:tRNA pseudouridine38-40 synthase